MALDGTFELLSGRRPVQAVGGGRVSSTGPARPRPGVVAGDELIDDLLERGQGQGPGADDLIGEHLLCRAFLSAWAPVLGDGPARDYLIDQARWRAAAARLLERHTLERLSRAFEHLDGIDRSPSPTRLRIQISPGVFYPSFF